MRWSAGQAVGAPTDIMDQVSPVVLFRPVYKCASPLKKPGKLPRSVPVGRGLAAGARKSNPFVWSAPRGPRGGAEHAQSRRALGPRSAPDRRGVTTERIAVSHVTPALEAAGGSGFR